MKEKGKEWNEYHKMVFEFNRAMQSFTYKHEGTNSSWGKTFPIKKVIFKGPHKKQEITLSGNVLRYLEAMFVSFNDTYSESQKQKMKEFSMELYSAHEEFMMQWIILFSIVINLEKQRF